MSGIPLRSFGGIKPEIDPRLLPIPLGQIAQNCRIKSGVLSPWKGKVFVNTPTVAGTKISMYRIPYGGTDYWLSWTTDVDMVRSQVANDAYNRYYYTGDGAPKVTNDYNATQLGGTNYPLGWFTLGLPILAAPSLAAAGGTGAATTRAYVFTEITAWGEEGPPSQPVTVTGKVDDTWTVSALPTAQPAGGTFQVVSKNIYRSVTASDGTSTFLYVANVALATASYADTASDASLVSGLVLGTTTYVMPPSGMTGLITLPNGCMAGFVNNQLCLSAPYQPHAWPIANRYSVDFPIVGIKAHGSQIAVCTTANPYIFSGTNPGAMVGIKSKIIEPCLSKRSMVDVGWAVLYASPNGIANAMDDGSDALQLMTDGSILPADWRAKYYPSAMFGAMYEEMYHLFWVGGSLGFNGIIWSLDSPTVGFRQASETPTALWTDPQTGSLYMMVAGSIYKWDADPNNNATASWRSKIIVEPKPLNYGAIQVDADYSSFPSQVARAAQSVLDASYNTTFLATTGRFGTYGPLGATTIGVTTLGGDLLHGGGIAPLWRFVNVYIYCNGVQRYSKTFFDSIPRKTTSGYKGQNWEIVVTSNVDVYSVKLAENLKAMERI